MDQKPFEDFLTFIEKKHGDENWVTVYKRIALEDGSEDGAFFCALVDQEITKSLLKDVSWELTMGNGGPGFTTSYESGRETTTYHRNSHEGLRPLVVYRDFYGRKPRYLEILEEFRLLHNLYFESKTGIYYDFDESGDEIEVIRHAADEIKIRRGYLRSFMAATQMNLALYFEITRHFHAPPIESADFSGDNWIAKIWSGESYSEGYESYVRILGKKVIRCDPVEHCGIWPYESQKSYEEFVIGGDVDDPMLFTCNPDCLSNYFGANPDAPHYLTPVFFKKEVMQKYYASTDYVVSDGYLSRQGSWALRFDNNSPKHVCVFLGDLGRDLPQKEQIYWKSYNLVPDGHRISRTNYERSILGNFFDSESPEHTFKHRFQTINADWKSAFGWPLFLPLAKADAHFFGSIRSMLSNEQSEFDSQILALTKVTIDSINVKALREFVGESNLDVKPIALMEQLFLKLNFAEVDQLTAFLRGVQSVRSTGVAHRKGTEYVKVIAKLNIDEDNYRAEFDQILSKFAALLQLISEQIPREKG